MALAWWTLAFCLLSALSSGTWAQHTVVLASTDPDIIYNPPPCDPSAVVAGCTSPWLSSAGGTPSLVSTLGPIPQAGDVIPQMFLTFRASALNLSTSALSNATVNFSLTAEPSDVFVLAVVNTTVNDIIVVDLPETQVITLGVTFVPQDRPTRFDVQFIALTVADPSVTSAFLPSPSLPATSSPPVFVPTPTTTTTATTTSNKHEKLIIIGTTLGVAVFALVCILASILITMHRRHRGRGARKWWSCST